MFEVPEAKRPRTKGPVRSRAAAWRRGLSGVRQRWRVTSLPPFVRLLPTLPGSSGRCGTRRRTGGRSSPCTRCGRTARGTLSARAAMPRVTARGSTRGPRPAGRDATTDADQIREWFERWPDANIGTPFPSVLDCDLPRDSDPADGVAEWRKLEKKHGIVTGAAVARSGGGGVHVYFAPGAPGGRSGRGSRCAARGCTRCSLPRFTRPARRIYGSGRRSWGGRFPNGRHGSRIARRRPRAS